MTDPRRRNQRSPDPEGRQRSFWSESADSLTLGFIMGEVKAARAEGRVPTVENVRGMLTGDVAGTASRSFLGFTVTDEPRSPATCRRQGRGPVQGPGSRPDTASLRGQPGADDCRSELAVAGLDPIFRLQPVVPGLLAGDRRERVHQVAGGSRQPVEPRHHQHITVVQFVEHLARRSTIPRCRRRGSSEI